MPDISLTAVKFRDISRFSRQVVTVNIERKQAADEVDRLTWTG